MRKILKILFKIVLWLMISVCLLLAVILFIAKRDSDGTATVFGYQMRIVGSPSMESCAETDVSEFEIKDIPVGSVIFIEVVPEENSEAWYESLKVGDVLTFRYTYLQEEVFTHRIIKISEKEGGMYEITLRGDNKNSDLNTLEQTIDQDQIIGKVVGQSYALGLILGVLKVPVVWITVIGIVLAIGFIIVLERRQKS